MEKYGVEMTQTPNIAGAALSLLLREVAFSRRDFTGIDRFWSIVTVCCCSNGDGLPSLWKEKSLHAWWDCDCLDSCSCSNGSRIKSLVGDFQRRSFECGFDF